MVNESILGGLKIAISHKSSLKDAMQSFYNSGYDKNEIEEASQIIFKEQQDKKNEPAKPVEVDENIKAKQIKELSSRKLKLIILIIIILLILFGGLVGIVIFRNKIF